MALYLNVPYEQEYKAIALGAKWDKDRKQWYAADKKDYRKLIKWYPYIDERCELICDYVYIVRSKYKCPYCNKNTNVIAFAVENYFEIDATKDGKIKKWKYHDEYVRLFERSDKVLFWSEEEQVKHEVFETYLKKRFGFYYYDPIRGMDYYANHCWECGSVLDMMMLHIGKGAPFYLDTFRGTGVPQPSNFKLFKILLSEDGLMTQSFTGDGYFSCDQFELDKNKKIELIDFKISIFDL